MSEARLHHCTFLNLAELSLYRFTNELQRFKFTLTDKALSAVEVVMRTMRFIIKRGACAHTRPSLLFKPLRTRRRRCPRGTATGWG